MPPILRSIGSVTAGWGSIYVLVTFTDWLLAKAFPHAYGEGVGIPFILLLLTLILQLLYSVVAGWVTARIAADQRWNHVMWLLAWGEVSFLSSAAAALLMGQSPLWPQVLMLAGWPAAVLLGGWICLGKK
jgi:hypothetical protein